MRPTRIRDLKMEEAIEMIEKFEKMYFTGYFSEDFIINKDLQTRRTVQGNYSVAQKKRVYFDEFFPEHKNKLEWLKNNFPALASRCERCIKEIDRLRKLVQDF